MIFQDHVRGMAARIRGDTRESRAARSISDILIPVRAWVRVVRYSRWEGDSPVVKLIKRQ